MSYKNLSKDKVVRDTFKELCRKYNSVKIVATGSSWNFFVTIRDGNYTFQDNLSYRWFSEPAVLYSYVGAFFRTERKMTRWADK